MSKSILNLMSIQLADMVSDPMQPRKSFPADEEANLGESLRKKQHVPLIVLFLAAQGKYMIIDGERRYRAASKAGLASLIAIVLDQQPNEAELLDLQLTANCQRADLNPIERLNAYKRLMELRGWNASKLAKNLATSKSTVSKILSLDRLSEGQRQQLVEGKVGLVQGYGQSRSPVPPNPSSDPTETSSKRVVCRLSNLSISIAGKSKLQLSDISEACRQLLKDCRKAAKEGLDLATFVKVLFDRSKASKGPRHGDAS